jgi:hypothetical protein
MNNLIISANEFNSAVKFLARVYALKKKGTVEEEKSIRNNKRLAIIVESDPIWVIENCGPFFLRYAELIKNREWDELMKQDFNEEKKKYKETDDGIDHTYESMDGKIVFIKNIFSNCKDKERELMGNAVQTMLSSYCKYALQVKNN